MAVDWLFLPGMELQTKEEVHLLCLFDTLEQAEGLQATVNRTLPDIENQPEHFGEQFVVDETGDFIRREPRLLITSANLTIEPGLAACFRPGRVINPCPH